MAMPARIKTGDEVSVIGGKDRGKRGRVLRVQPERDRVCTSRASTCVKRHQTPAAGPRRPAGRAIGGVIEQRGPDPPLQRDAARPQGRQAHAPARRNRAVAGRQALRRPDREAQRELQGLANARCPLLRLKSRYVDEIRPALMEHFGYSSADAGPAAREDHRQRGRRRHQAGRERCSRRRTDQLGDDHRAVPERPPRSQVDRCVQGARGHAGRRRRHAPAASAATSSWIG